VPDLRRRVHLWRARRPYVTSWSGGPLLVLPGVLDPVATKVGAWLAAQVAAEARPGERWVDMGCGSGIVGIALARAGARVTCVDIDPEAVRCTRANAALNGVDLEVLEGDLFAPLGARRFDAVAYNVPFWRGRPAGPFGRALYAGENFEAIRAFTSTWTRFADRARVPLSRAGPGADEARRALGGAPLVSARVAGEDLDLFGL
jgi:release factor glutamine methyltransferase